MKVKELLDNLTELRDDAVQLLTDIETDNSYYVELYEESFIAYLEQAKLTLTLWIDSITEVTGNYRGTDNHSYGMALLPIVTNGNNNCSIEADTIKKNTVSYKQENLGIGSYINEEGILDES